MLKFDGSSAVTEGIGIGRVTANRERLFPGGPSNAVVTRLGDGDHKCVSLF